VLSAGGFFLGENWLQIVPLAQDYELVWEVLLAFAVAAFVLWNFRHRHR